jgi:hypothetical protein
MSTTPAPWSIPYPEGTDRVIEGDNAMKAIADRVAALNTQSLIGAPVQGIPCSNGAGWAGGATVSLRSGWVHLFINQTKANWIANEVIGQIPVGYRPLATLYSAVLASNNGAPVGIYVSNTSGQIAVTVAAALGGLVGHVAYPLWP